GERLMAIEQQERPALLQERQQASQLQLLTAEAKPLQQQLAQLQNAQRQLHALLAQQQADGQQLAALQQQASHDQSLQQQHTQALEQLQQQCSQLEHQQQHLARQQEVLAIQRDLATLERQHDQLRQHKQQFETLQQQAGAIKQQLQDLPVITPEQVRQLRQCEQALAQAQARCQGMATRLSLLSRDQSVTLDDQPVLEGQELTIEQPAVLQIGSGTRLQLSPASGQASDAARQQREQAETQLAELQTRLAYSSSDAAEAVAQQRLALESELSNLRKTAQTIPWAKLEAQLAELPPRRQRLLDALAAHDAVAAPVTDLAALEASQDTLKQNNLQLAAQLRQSLEQRSALQRELDALNQQHSQRQSEIGRLNGALAAAAAQLQQLQQLHGDAAALAQGEHELRLSLEASEGRITALKQQLGQATELSSTAESRLQQLESEKDLLLTRRGQQEQLCRSLGASDPVAALEQLQAAWELAAAERQRLEQRTAALQLLLQLFRSAQQELGSRYCLPLQSSLQGYLEALELPSSGSAQMHYDPQEGFGALQLQQGNQSFGFTQLSGGMREQLAGGLRLALAEVLQPAYDNCLPLIFDDAFSNSDPLRREGVLRMLQRGIDRGLQIIVFSCTPADFGDLAQASGLRIDLPARESSAP
ncbi:MAG: ATP-binding protein, partial [Prochlorococcaceae cyanobacterium]